MSLANAVKNFINVILKGNPLSWDFVLALSALITALVETVRDSTGPVVASSLEVTEPTYEEALETLRSLTVPQEEGAARQAIPLPLIIAAIKVVLKKFAPNIDLDWLWDLILQKSRG